MERLKKKKNMVKSFVCEICLATLESKLHLKVLYTEGTAL